MTLQVLVFLKTSAHVRKLVDPIHPLDRVTGC